MEWKIKIEGKSSQQILVEYDPLTSKIIFSGQHKPHNREWVTVYTTKWDVETIILEDVVLSDAPMGINIEVIKGVIDEVYEVVKKRIDVYETLDKGFKIMKTVEFKED